MPFQKPDLHLPKFIKEWIFPVFQNHRILIIATQCIRSIIQHKIDKGHSMHLQGKLSQGSVQKSPCRNGMIASSTFMPLIHLDCNVLQNLPFYDLVRSYEIIQCICNTSQAKWSIPVIHGQIDVTYHGPHCLP